MRARPFPLQPPAAQPQLTGPISPHNSVQLSNKAGLFAFLTSQGRDSCNRVITTQGMQGREVSLSLLTLIAFAFLKSNRRAEEEEKGGSSEVATWSGVEALHSWLIPSSTVLLTASSYAHMLVCTCMRRPEVNVKCLLQLPNFLRQGFSVELTDWASQAG